MHVLFSLCGPYFCSSVPSNSSHADSKDPCSEAAFPDHIRLDQGSAYTARSPSLKVCESLKYHLIRIPFPLSRWGQVPSCARLCPQPPQPAWNVAGTSPRKWVSGERRGLIHQALRPSGLPSILSTFLYHTAASPTRSILIHFQDQFHFPEWRKNSRFSFSCVFIWVWGLHLAGAQRDCS